MSIVLRTFNSSRFVRAFNTSCFRSYAVPKYSTLPSNFGYVSIAQRNQSPVINYCVIVQRFYSGKANTNPTQKPVEHDEKGAEIIYSGNFRSRIIRVKLFSLSTSVLGIVAQPVLLKHGMEIGGKGLAAFLCTLAGIFTFVTPVLLHFITKKYVIKITHDPKTDEYVATTVSFWLMKNEVKITATFSSMPDSFIWLPFILQTKFKIEDIKIPEIETMFTTFTVGPEKIPLLVDATDFTDTHHFARFMGYDKPVEFELTLEEGKQRLGEKADELPNK